MGNIARLDDKWKKKHLEANIAQPDIPLHVGFLLECGIDYYDMNPEHQRIMRCMADSVLEILNHIAMQGKNMGEVFSLDDLKIIFAWYHWGLIRGKRKTTDLKTSRDCIHRIANYAIRKLDSLVTYKLKAVERANMIESVRQRITNNKKLRVVKKG